MPDIHRAKQYWNTFCGMHEGWILLFLFLAALIVRAIGINYGYWHGDERIGDAAKVLGGQLVPGQHFYPPLLNYINAVFLAILYAVGRLIPVWYDTAGFRAQYFADPTAFYLTARLVTAAMGAAAAPLFYILAKSLKLPKASCLLAGIFGILIPAMILLSHFSKSDIALATASVLVIFVLLKKHEYLTKPRYDVFLGLAIALALSFKHSYVFILAPLMLGHACLLWRAIGFSHTVKSLALTGACMLPAWCVLNIGILLDFQNFLDFQKIQANMSVRSGEPPVDAFAVWFSLATHTAYGINIIATMLFIAFPFYLNSRWCLLKDRAILNIAWISLTLATVVLVLMSGTRQHSGLWVPYYTCMQLFAALLLADAIRSNIKPVKLVTLVTAALFMLTSLYGSGVIWRQSLAEPIADKVAHMVKENYSERKIIASFILRLPQQKEAKDAEYARHENLAKKYNVTMPERAEERLVTISEPGAIYYFGMPGVMFGLEQADDESLGDAVKPYAWPLQKEEWFLDYWLAQDFSVFVISDHHYYLNESPAREFRRFHQELEDKCKKVTVFTPEKPLFLEATVTVFDCI